MTRAYIRLDPAFDEHKYEYPDGAYAALVGTLCLAELQPERGRFRSVDYLRRLLGKRGRWVNYLLEHQDVIEMPDGRAYVDGWDQWQEGDWKVTERVHRIRTRRNAPANADVTVDVTATRLDSAAQLSGAVTAEQSGAVRSGAEERAPDSADVYWNLTGRYPTDKVLGWLDELSSEYGVEAVIRALAKAHLQDRSAATLLGRTTDVLRSEARALSLKAQEEQRQRLKERRAAPREIVDPAAVQAEMERILRGEAA